MARDVIEASTEATKVPQPHGRALALSTGQRSPSGGDFGNDLPDESRCAAPLLVRAAAVELPARCSLPPIRNGIMDASEMARLRVAPKCRCRPVPAAQQGTASDEVDEKVDYPAAAARYRG